MNRDKLKDLSNRKQIMSYNSIKKNKNGTRINADIADFKTDFNSDFSE